MRNWMTGAALAAFMVTGTAQAQSVFHWPAPSHIP